MKKSLIVFIFIISTLSYSYGQCVQCEEQTASGTNASIIGPNNTASGAGSVAMGANSHTHGLSAIAIGGMLQAINPYSFVIGTGGTPSKKLINGYAESLMIGFNSTKPTFFISTSPSNLQYDRTGKVGIGNITEPYTKLHIKADEGEDAAVFIEPNTWTENSNATLLLGNMFHGLTANSEYGLVFSTQKNYILNNGNVGIGTQIPEEKLHVNGTILTNGFKMPQPGIKDGYVLTTDRNGNSAWLPTQSLWELGEDNNIYRLEGNVGIGTEIPSSTLEVKSNGIDKWAATIRNTNMEGKGLLVKASHVSYNKPVLQLQDHYGIALLTVFPKNGGLIGIGTNTPDEKLHVNGKVVIGGQNLIRPEGYKLYVEEGIITEKVKVELVSNWSDFVFDKNYQLRSIGDLEKFIKENKHLPDIPSARDVKENGIDLGEMDAKLLQKIEELTLYIIQHQKEIEYLKSQIEELKK